MVYNKLNRLFFVFLLGYGTTAFAQVNGADRILHDWEMESREGKIRISKSGNTYNANMLYGKRLVEADGKTYKKDVNNPDPALRSRSLKGYTLVSGLVYKDDKWVDGKVYNFEDGHEYDANIEIKGEMLYMRVYKGVPLLGKTVKWHLVQ